MSLMGENMRSYCELRIGNLKWCNNGISFVREVADYRCVEGSFGGLTVTSLVGVRER